MAIVLVLLATGKLRLTRIREGAEWFLAEMLLFFVPTVPALLDHREYFGLVGLRILTVIVVGTVVVMVVTAMTVEFCSRWRSAPGRAGS